MEIEKEICQQVFTKLLQTKLDCKFPYSHALKFEKKKEK